MRSFKSAFAAVVAAGLLLGTAAHADDLILPPLGGGLAQLDAFYETNPVQPPLGMPVEVCINVSDPRAVGVPCTISDASGVLATLILMPGANHMVVCPTSLDMVVAGPGIEPKYVNPGSN